MIFGFLVLDILLFGLIPLIVLGCLAADKKFWAGALTLFVFAILTYNSWDTITFDAAFISTILIYAAGWLGVGAIFSFIKWKMHNIKVARRFQEHLQRYDFHAAGERFAAEWKAQRDKRHAGFLKGVAGVTGESEPLTADEKEAMELAREKGIELARAEAASRFNTSYNIVRLTPKTPSGWNTDYRGSDLAEYATSWIVWWPFYVVLLVLDDFIRNLIDWFLKTFGQAYRKIMHSSFDHIN